MNILIKPKDHVPKSINKSSFKIGHTYTRKPGLNTRQFFIATGFTSVVSGVVDLYSGKYLSFDELTGDGWFVVDLESEWSYSK